MEIRFQRLVLLALLCGLVPAWGEAGEAPARDGNPGLRLCVARAVGEPGPCIEVRDTQWVESVRRELSGLEPARQMHPAKLARMAVGAYRGVTIEDLDGHARPARITQACAGLARVVSRVSDGNPRYEYFTGAERLENRVLDLLVERGLVDEALVADRRPGRPRPAALTRSSPLRPPEAANEADPSR